ncbi:MAG: peptide ABC transporter substrate-binding protein [Devosia sp.]
MKSLVINRRTAIAGLLAGVAATSLTFNRAFAQETKRLVLATAEALDNLDPRVLLTTAHQSVQIGIFDSLVRSKGADIAPGAAESWEISADGKTYTFHLRDAKWSDGKAVVGGDFVHAFQRMFTASGASQIYDDILNGADVRGGTKKPEELGVAAPDDKTVVITLKNPTPYFLGLISSSYAAPGRADLLEKFKDAYGASADSMAYNGPFVLAEWENENQLLLKKNPDYWDAANIKLEEVQVLVLPDVNTQRNLFDSQELDIYTPATDSEVQGYKDAGLLQTYNRGGYRGITINRYANKQDPVKAKLLSNVNFMKAISFAIDRQGFVDNVLGGNGLPATVQTPAAHAVYPGTTWGEVTPNEGKYHPVTADKAKSADYLAKALSEAGFASVGDVPPLDLLTSEDPANPKLVTPYVQSVLSEMGFKVNLIQATGNNYWNTFLEPALGFDLCIAGWGPDFDDPATYMGYWVSSSKDMGATFDNADFDALLTKANAETDLKARATILGQAEALFADIGPAIPIIHYKGNVAVQSYVKDLLFSIFGVNIIYIYADIQK